jgi:hypothetical protein
MPRRPRGEPATRQFFTTGDLSSLFGVAPRTVIKWIDSGLLEGFRLPGSADRRVRLESLSAFLAAHPEFGIDPVRPFGGQHVIDFTDYHDNTDNKNKENCY